MLVGLRRFLLAFLVATVVVPSVQAQTAQAAPQIAGRVVRADTGAPIAGAQVTLVPPIYEGAGLFPTTVTDSDGNYSFPAAAYGGDYEISASADGFCLSTYSRDGTLEAEFEKIDPSTHLAGIDFRLTPEAVIRGTVVTADGHPVANIPVVAVYSEHRVPGGKFGSGAQTDADGNFALKRLAAGSYYVVVNGPNSLIGSHNTGLWYRETWYGNKPSREGATEIALKEGGEQDGVQIAVEPETRYKLTIWPSGPEGGPTPDHYMVTLKGRNTMMSGNRDGSFTLLDIPPGHYTLVTSAYYRSVNILDSSNILGDAETGFDVTNSDVTMRVKVGRMSSVQGTVRWATGNGNMRQVIVGLATAEDRAAHRATNGSVGVDGSFGFYGLKPGTYTLQLNPAPAGMALQSVHCNGAAITSDTPIVLGDKQDVTGCEVVLDTQKTD
jgi:hypothetical protein